MLKKVIENVKSIFSHRLLFPLILAGMAAILGALTLDKGLLMDDYFHKQIFTSGPENLIPAPIHKDPILSSFTFMGGEENVKYFMDLGLTPWWTSPDLKISFFRPLSGLSHWIDYTLWPDTPWVMHLHSLLLYVVLALLALRFFRAFVPVLWAAGLGALLFIINDTMAVPLGWLANRNAIIALIFCFLSLLAHKKAREESKPSFLFLSALMFLASLLSGELGIATFAYLLSYALFLDRDTLKRRILSLLPYLGIIVGWRILYRVLEFGTTGNSFYLEPEGNFLLFLYHLIQRLPVMAASVLNGFLLDFTMAFSEEGFLLFSLLTLIVSLLLIKPLKPFWKNCDKTVFWFMGLLFAVVPFCLTLPSIRNLAFPSIGGMGLLATWAGNLKEIGGLKRQPLISKLVFGFLIAVNLVLAPFGFLVSLHFLSNMDVDAERYMGIETIFSLNAGELVMLNTTGGGLLIYAAGKSYIEDPRWPRYIRVLSTGSESVTISREGASSLVVTPELGFVPPAKRFSPGDSLIEMKYRDRVFAKLFSDIQGRYSPGDRLSLSGLSVEILSLTEDSRPLSVAYHFSGPLEEGDRRFILWDYESQCFREVPVPALGETLVLNRIPAKQTVVAAGGLSGSDSHDEVR